MRSVRSEIANVLALALLVGAIPGGVTPLLAGMEELDPHARAFVEAHCVRCHGPEKQKGDFQIDTLGLSENVADAEYWQLVLDAIQLGDMPPPDEPQPDPAEIERMAEWIGAELKRARSALRGNTGEVVLRRLNATEYRNTVRDLFGIETDLTVAFPEDAKVHGFDNNGAGLMLSVAQMEEYLNAANEILDRSLVTPGERPELRRGKLSLHRINEEVWESFRKGLEKRKATYDVLTPVEKERTDKMIEEFEKDPYYAYRFPVFENGTLRAPRPGEPDEIPAAIPTKSLAASTPNTRDVLDVREPGTYRISFRAFGINNDREPAELLVEKRAMNQRGAVPTLVDRIRFTDGQERDFTYELHLEPQETVLFNIGTGQNSTRPGTAHELETPMVGLYPVTIEGPIIEEWPPRGYQTLVGEFDPASDDPENVKGLIRHAASHLFRRPVEPRTVEDYYGLYGQFASDQGHEAALRNTLKALLASPQFLYQVEFGDGIDQYALASRLSYFLWRSTPDRQLLQLAAEGKLSDPQVLQAQTERLLDDPRSERFLEDFVGQWMRTDHVGEMTPDMALYPEWDDLLRQAMVAETEGFFRELIEKNLSLENLIDADWTILNERLAKHYGIPGVEGLEFRRVDLDRSETIRGGLLTQGTFLNITSNGTTTSPIIRGVWLLENFLGTPTPPPPPNVPVIEPDVRGAKNIKDQLALHREIPQCASCHTKIDPLGIALENFDVIGGWRDQYRAVTENKNPRRGPTWQDGPAVDPVAESPALGAFDSFEAFRNRIKEYDHLVYENTAHKLATFALGRDLTFADNENLHQIVAETERQGLGMRSMIHALIQNELFRNP